MKLPMVEGFSSWGKVSKRAPGEMIVRCIQFSNRSQLMIYFSLCDATFTFSILLLYLHPLLTRWSQILPWIEYIQGNLNTLICWNRSQPLPKRMWMLKFWQMRFTKFQKFSRTRSWDSSLGKLTTLQQKRMHWQELGKCKICSWKILTLDFSCSSSRLLKWGRRF